MNTITKLASVAVVTLVLATGSAGAFDPIGVNESIAPTAQDSIQGAVQTGGSEQNIQTAVQFDPIRDINDAVINGANVAKPGKGKVVINGRTILVALSCEAGGTEVLTLRNKGDMVPAGTKLRWEVKSLGERGAVQLKAALGHGDQVRVDVGMDVDAGTPCAAKAI